MKQLRFPRLPRWTIFVVGAVIIVTLLGSVYGQSVAWWLVKRQVRHDFPAVPRTDPAPLAGWLADAQRAPPLLLDVRTRAEYDVSHLPGAIHVAPDADPVRLDLPRDRPIVTYCSVGYRSAAFAGRLQAAGFREVVNLEGSLFQWANEGRPLVRDGQVAQRVHPYNFLWGRLLESSRRAPSPPAAPGGG